MKCIAIGLQQNDKEGIVHDRSGAEGFVHNIRTRILFVPAGHCKIHLLPNFQILRASQAHPSSAIIRPPEG